MPELPEVQTVINYLKTKIINQKIEKINLIYSKLLKNASEKKFLEFLKNETFIDIKRKGKFLIFLLTHNKTFVVHLRMEGKLFAQEKNSLPDHKQLCAEFYLNDYILRYYDTRKFGTFEILDTHDYEQLKSVHKLEIDANDPQFDKKFLFKKFQHCNRKIKTALLDQSIVAGLGNIYVNEVLYDAKLHPEKIANSLTLEQCEKVVIACHRILNEAIELKGTTVHSFKFNEVSTGGYQERLQVHFQKNKHCKKCDELIQFTKINGRGTYFCPKCQKK